MGRHVLALCALMMACGKVVPTKTTVIEGPCAISEEEWPLAEPSHVLQGTAITWDSNPPTSGSHYPRWAAFQEFTSPVPRGNWLHSAEHGAIVLLYNCDALPQGTDCEPFKQVLRDASAALPSDGMCAAPVRVRTVITPDPLIDTPIVAVAWGFVYRAACPDLASLTDFAKRHYAKGPENLCAAGVTSF